MIKSTLQLLGEESLRGLLLKGNYCAEHEWGIQPILKILYNGKIPIEPLLTSEQ